jgi:hypothetical protein
MNNMKTKNAVWVILTGVFSYFFYQETLGWNLAIFTILLIIGRLLINSSKVKDFSWLATAIAGVISAISVALYGNTLSIIANLISIVLLVGMDRGMHASVVSSLLEGTYSLISSPIFMVLDLLEKKSTDNRVKMINKIILIAIIPVLIVIVFFFMYRSSNAIFEQLTNQLNFKWFSFGWIFFTLMGMALIYGFYKVIAIKELNLLNDYSSHSIRKENTKTFILFEKEISINEEYLSGVLLLVLLNILLFFVNLGDFHFLFISHKLPENVTFASFLHQGVGMLIVSILISIFIIIFYFRGSLNFYEKSKSFKIWAFIWIVQNVLMLGSVVSKNALYIDAYGLTYKRIGIYVYVLLTIIGLVTTALKIIKVKNIYYLIRINGWSFFVVLVLSSLIHWDKLIINENQSLKRDIDIYYLLSLSDSILPDLKKVENNIRDKEEKVKYHQLLEQKIRLFQLNQEKLTWKSSNIIDYKTYKLLTKSN